jgi:hypothetical protein
LTRALPARYVPPSGFGYPLDGLLPFEALPAPFMPAALLGFTLRSLPSPEVPERHRPGRTHIPFASIGEMATAAATRDQRTAVPGLRPSGEFLPRQKAVDLLVTRRLPWVFPF